MDTERLQTDDIIAKGKERAGRRGRRRRHLPLASRRLETPIHPGGVDRYPEPARRRHHLRVRRAHHPFGQHPRLPGELGAAHPRVGGAVPGRAPPAAAACRRSGRGRRCSAWCRALSTRTLRRQAASGLASDRRGGRTAPRGSASTATASAVRWRSRTGRPSSGWVSSELPADKPRHLLGISEPDDLLDAVAAGADTFDCVRRRGWRATPRCTRRPGGSTSPAPGTSGISPRSTPNAIATPAPTTPAPISRHLFKAR